MHYLHEKLGKKLSELKKLHQMLKDEYEVYGASIKPQRALVTRWIDHKMNAMRQIINKYGLYVTFTKCYSGHV